MKRVRKKVFRIMMCMLLVIATTSGYVYAESEVDGFVGASPINLYQDNREITVSQKIPSGDSVNDVYDVVFVMDSSTSTAAYGREFVRNIKDLINVLKEKDISVKIGIVKFKGRAVDCINACSGGIYSGLTLYNDSTDVYINSAADVPILFSRGSNLHGGLQMANNWLAADTDVPDSNKFVVMLTDCKTFIWDDNGVATSIYSQYYSHYRVTANAVVYQQSNRDKGYYSVGDSSRIVAFNGVDRSDDEAFAALYNSTNPELASRTKYDLRCGYAYGEGSTLASAITHETTNGEEVFPGNDLEDYRKYYEIIYPAGMTEGIQTANPYKVIKTRVKIDSAGTVIPIDNNEPEEEGYTYDYTYTFDTDTPDDDYYMYHVSSVEKGVYKAAHLWNDMVSTYNCGAALYRGGSFDSGLSLCVGFGNWVMNVSDYASDVSNENCTEEMAALFDPMEKGIVYAIDRGTVTNAISDEFALIDDGITCPFTITKKDQVFTGTPIGDNKWTFSGGRTPNYTTKGVDGVDCIVEYDNLNKKIKWIINEPVEKKNPLILNYRMMLDENSENGEYQINEESVFEYYSTGNDTSNIYNFDIPVVTYTKSNPNNPDNPVSPENPGESVNSTDSTGLQTGDNENISFWTVLLALSGIAIAVASLYSKREKGFRD